MQAVFLFILLVISEGITSMTVITQPEINATLGKDRSIALNCTFSTGTLKSISSMIWVKKIGNAYIDLAQFKQYPDPEVRLTGNGSYLINRSQLVFPGNGSTNSFILTINDIECREDGKYQCWLNYLTDAGRTIQITGDTTVFLQVDAEQPSSFTLYPNETLRENDTVILSCSANVGNPEGYIAIWKIDMSENVRVLLNKSNLVEEENENCSTFTHLTVNYTVSRNDNGASFNCSSQNRQSQVPGPSRGTNHPMNILYGPSEVEIHIWPTSLTFFVGSDVKLTCNSDGNPDPTFKWIFNSTQDRYKMMRPLTWKNRSLILKNVNLNDSGVYLCEASNSINGEILLKSSNITLKVQERERVTVNQTCGGIQCGITQSCIVEDYKAFCVGNKWAYVAFSFILLTLVFGVTTLILCFKSTKLKNKTSININGDVKLGEHVQSQSNDYDLSGYTDPKDVTKLCPESKKSGTDNTTYADPVDTNQYASVRKTENTTNPPNVYDGAWV